MRNVLVLGLAQLFASCGQVVTVLLGGLVGAALAPDPRLVTVPVMSATVGIAAATLPAGWLMQRFGRRPIFMGAGLWAAAGCLLAAQAIQAGDFWWYCAGCAVVGSNTAFVAQYRFAASESVEPHQVGRAVSLVMLGVVGSALLGPWLVVLARGWTGAEFAGSYFALAAVYFLGIATLTAYREVPSPPQEQTGPARPLSEIARQPEFRVAVGAAAVAYGVMSLIMTATPVSMHTMHGHSVEDTTLVLQSHVLAMYLPSLASGYLVARLGIIRMTVVGLLAEGSCAAIASLGHGVVHYWAGLVALGVGWNLLFVAGTTLLTRTYRPAERFRVQALNDFLMFGVMGSVSMLAGVLINLVGWERLNQISLVPLAALAVASYALARRPPTRAGETAAP
jgi:MFS family permease